MTRRDVVLVCIGLFLVAYGTNISTPFLVLYRERLDLSDSATMAIFTVYVVGILATLLVAGPISDRLGRRRVSVPALALSGVASLLFVPGRDTFILLLGGRLLLGIVSGAALGVGAAWLQELLGPGREKQAAVMTTVITYAGFGLGPPISAVFEQFTGSALVTPFLLHAAVTVVFVPFLRTAHETTSRTTEARRLRIELGVPTHGRRTFWIIVVPAAIWVFSFPSTSFALFPVLVSSSIPGAEVAVAAGAGALTAWSALLARPVVGRFGARTTLPLAMGAGTVGYLLGGLAFGTNTWILVLPAAFLLGAASGSLTAAVLAILAVLADPGTRGALNSTFYLLAYPGMAMPIAITAVSTGLGTAETLTALTLVAALATLWMTVTWWREGLPRSVAIT